MDLQARHLILLFATLTVVSSSEAHQYHVGGKEGWTVNPHVRYNHWSDRTRFVINDSLVFKYKKGGDSVLLVTKDDYYNCNTRSPVARWNDGANEVALNRSGAFFFISGEEEHCQKGQRMIVVVLPWSPQPPISLPPESPLPKPPRASPVPRADAPKLPPPTAATPVRSPTQSTAPIGSPSSRAAIPPGSPKHTPAPASTPTSTPALPTTPVPRTAPSLSPPSPASTPTKAPAPESTISPSPSSYMPTPAGPAPAPAQSSASAVTGGHHVLVVTLLLSAIF